MRTIDIAVANAFMAGVEKTIGDTQVRYTTDGYAVTCHNVPIVWWDSADACLRFSLNGNNTTMVKNRVNGIMTYLHQKLILPRSWVIRTKRGMLQLVESGVFTYVLTDLDTVTISNVCNLTRPNHSAVLTNIGPNIPDGVNKCEAPALQSQKQEAAFLTFDDLSGVC